MLKKERQREALKIINDTGKVEVEVLSKRLGVSSMTIRRDLGELNQQGLVERVHGGALQVNNSQDVEPPVIERTKDKTDIKQRIGQHVAGMIQSGETIFLGSGSTTSAVADAIIKHHKITVITNALNIASKMVWAPEIKVAVTGGFLRRSELSLIGHFAENALDGLRVDKVIIGMRGIDPVKGLTSGHMDELMTDQAILGISKNIIVVADYSKLGYVAAIRTAPITAATTIVTNCGGSKDILQAIRLMGVRIIEI